MTPALQIYFQAEKRAAMFFLAIGILACWSGSVLFMRAAAPFYIGIALPLLAFGIFQIIVGTTVLRRTDLQVDDLERLLADEPVGFRQQEQPRMDKVIRNFSLLRWARIAMIVVGILLFIGQQDPVISKGLGLGLTIQGAIMLIADYFAEKRAKIYQSFIATIVNS